MKDKITFRLCGACSVLILLVAALGLESCTKEREQEQSYDTVSAEDNALADNILGQIDQDLNKAYNEKISQVGSQQGAEKPSLSPKSGCVSISLLPFDTTSWPKELVIDYGNYCTDQQNNSRSGKIVAVYTDRYQNPGAQITVKLDQYYLNGYQVDGTKIIVNDGLTKQNHWQYSESMKDAIITKPDGKTIEWEQITLRKWINVPTYGLNTSDVPAAKIYQITGTRSGKDSNDKKYNVTIVKPLIVSTDCDWTTAGSIEMTSEDYTYTITIDYGNGDCDQVATMTIMDLSFTFNM